MCFTQLGDCLLYWLKDWRPPLSASAEEKRFHRQFWWSVKTAVFPRILENSRARKNWRPEHVPEPMCNPIGQAMALNKSQTDLNIILGLCVGHDTLFIKYSQAPVTVLGCKGPCLRTQPYGGPIFGRQLLQKQAAPLFLLMSG